MMQYLCLGLYTTNQQVAFNMAKVTVRTLLGGFDVSKKSKYGYICSHLEDGLRSAGLTPDEAKAKGRTLGRTLQKKLTGRTWGRRAYQDSRVYISNRVYFFPQNFNFFFSRFSLFINRPSVAGAVLFVCTYPPWCSIQYLSNP